MKNLTSRRTILKTAGALWVTTLLGCVSNNVPTLDNAAPTRQPTPEVKPELPTSTTASIPIATVEPTTPPAFTPTPGNTNTAEIKAPDLGIFKGKVIYVHSDQAVNWSGQVDYWNSVNQAPVSQMINTGIMALTGQSSEAEAWKMILPDYQPGQGIAIKVNFNNAFWDCNDAKGKINALPQPVNSIIEGLKKMGVAENDIWLYDGVNRSILSYFVSGLKYPGVKLFGKCQEAINYNYGDPDQQITFHPPEGTPQPDPNTIIDVLVKARYLINMPIIKNHSCSGVTLAFKNHFGSVSNPGGMHEHVFVTCGKYFSTTYNPLVDLYMNPNIVGKTRLTIADGLFCCKGAEDGEPSTWTTFKGKTPNSLFFSVDPVAADSVMCDFLSSEPGGGFASGADSYLNLASQAGLGVFERGDFWGKGYSQINLQKIEL
jgi:hypothetical protein